MLTYQDIESRRQALLDTLPSNIDSPAYLEAIELLQADFELLDMAALGIAYLERE